MVNFFALSLYDKQTPTKKEDNKRKREGKAENKPVKYTIN